MDIELTPEKHQEHIDTLYGILNSLNEDLPPVEGNGNLEDALSYLSIELASTILHSQRSFVLIDSILEFINNQKQATQAGFKKTGENFSGTAPSVN